MKYLYWLDLETTGLDPENNDSWLASDHHLVPVSR